MQYLLMMPDSLLMSRTVDLRLERQLKIALSYRGEWSLEHIRLLPQVWNQRIHLPQFQHKPLRIAHLPIQQRHQRCCIDRRNLLLSTQHSGHHLYQHPHFFWFRLLKSRYLLH